MSCPPRRATSRSCAAACSTRPRGYGYELVMPPLLEHLESLLSGTGQALDLQTFKLVDQLSGRTLGLRADTHAAGRAHRRAPAQPQRRRAPVLLRPGAAHAARPACTRRASRCSSAPRSTATPGLEADLEILRPGARLPAGAPASTAAPSTWPTRASCARCSPACRSTRAALDARARRARGQGRAGSRRSTPSFPAPAREALQALLACTATPRCSTKRARALPRAPAIARALDDLRWLAARAPQPARAVGFDLADLRGYAYYSGARFAVYAPGASDALARGGRYDEVGAVFGRNRPAVGFSLDLKELAGVAADAPRARRRSARRGGDDAGAARARSPRCASRARSWSACCRATSSEVRRVRTATASSSRERPARWARARRSDAVSNSFANAARHARTTTRPQRRRRRHPVGRRRQGQGRRLADRPRAGRGALPGRPQRRPHAGHQRREDGAAADPVGHHARRRGLLHRQRRRAVDPAHLLERDRAAWRRSASKCARACCISEVVPADPAVPRRGRHGARGAARVERRRQDRHHRQGHRPGLRRQGRAPRAARAGPEAPGALRRQAARAARPAQLRARRSYLHAQPLDFQQMLRRWR